MIPARQRRRAFKSGLALTSLASGDTSQISQLRISLGVQVIEGQCQRRNGLVVASVAYLETPRVVAAGGGVIEELLAYVGLGVGGIEVGQVEGDEGEDVGVGGGRAWIRIQSLHAKIVIGCVFADTAYEFGRLCCTGGGNYQAAADEEEEGE